MTPLPIASVLGTVPRFRPLFFVLGFLIFWGAPLTHAEVSLRGGQAGAQGHATAAQAGGDTLSRSGAWLGLRIADPADVVEGDEFDFAPIPMEGGAVSLHVPVAEAAFFQVAERSTDRRPATLVGTVVLMI